MTQLPEELVRDLLRSNGMLDAFVDYRGRDRDAPVLQLFEFREDSLQTDQRCVFIRMTGDSSVTPHLLQNHQVVVGFVSLNTDGDLPVARFRADEIYNFFLDNFAQCQMHGLVPSRPGQPYTLGSKRRVFEITVDIQIGREAAQP